MSIIVLLFCFGVFMPQLHGATETPNQKFVRIHHSCQANPSTHIDPAELSKFDHGEDVHNPSLGSHLLCMQIGMGLQDHEGNTPPDFQDLVKELASEPDDERLVTLAEACGKRSPGSPEELAVALRRCINEYYPELIFMHDP